MNTKVHSLEFYVKKGIEEALAKIKSFAEDVRPERNRLHFHQTRHTKDVYRRTELILLAVREIEPNLVSKHNLQIGLLAAGFHDVVQEWVEEKVPEGKHLKLFRRRLFGSNERASIGDTVGYMNRVNKEAQTEIFSWNDKVLVTEAINVTIPSFDPKVSTVVQPNLLTTTSMVARAVALADLGTAGLDGQKSFSYDGDAIFREENMDVFDASRSKTAIAREDKEYFRERMIKQSDSQSKFAEGRRHMLRFELDGLSPRVKASIWSLFNKFPESIRSAKIVAAKRSKMTFENLLYDMGFLEK